MNKALLLGLLIGGLAAAAPEGSARPGGVAILDLGPVDQAAPSVTFEDKPVLVMRDGDRW
ncbi:MAG: M23 family peptidase, partial [Gammaproteobacteria bacterium]|nr:M23 family peptidase [Gammaproteobacteria bacterium]